MVSDESFIGQLALVVEDNKVNQLVLKQYLLKLGFSVDVAENGLIACQLCADKKYDFIFMDIHMPIMNGLEATTEIRNSDTENSNTIIIAVTSDVSSEDKAKCLKTGMNWHICKPINLELIKECLVNCSY